MANQPEDNKWEVKEGRWQRVEGVWQKDNSRAFTTYKIRLNGGTLTAFYDPMSSKHHLGFFPHSTPTKEHYGTADYTPYAGLTTHGNAKGTILGLYKISKELPGFPLEISEGLEKLIEKLNESLD